MIENFVTPILGSSEEVETDEDGSLFKKTVYSLIVFVVLGLLILLVALCRKYVLPKCCKPC